MVTKNQLKVIRNSKLIFALLFLSTLLISGCAGTKEAVKETENHTDAKSEVDPYENFNRSMFKFNDKLDAYVAKPISDAYLWITPNFLKTGVTNFFSNLKDINVVLNDNMQGKFSQGFEDTGRLLANSTVGLLGFFDVASELGLIKHQEDFGQTLAVWGVPQGAYLVLPLLGPTTTRGLPGSVFDTVANPTTYVGMPVQLVSMLNTRANADGALKFIDEAAIDPYVFTREAFLQNLQHLISDGKSNGNINILPLEDDIENEIYSDDKPKPKTKTSLTENKRNLDDSGSAVKSQVENPLDAATSALDKASQEFEATSAKMDKLSSRVTKKKVFKKRKIQGVLPPS